VLVGGIAAFATVDEMVSLTNIGTLFAFILVCIGVIVLRYKDHDRYRPFRVPFGPWLLPGLGALSCAFLIYYLPGGSYWRFVAWLALGFAIYLSYGYSHSALGIKMGRARITSSWLMLMAFGSFLIAIGLLIIPHDEGPAKWLELAKTGFVHGTRVIIAFSFAAVGLLFAAIGGVIGMSKDGTAAPS
jgi:APA family basic amino acid/polyamine antiporter